MQQQEVKYGALLMPRAGRVDQKPVRTLKACKQCIHVTSVTLINESWSIEFR